ncbi:MAG: type II toxin-antitoxin system VapC family toxin [Brevundimonas sp.]|uniref:type II toxin-antitoxin system VapC family toxin n=1 Tax=Brevundimonas sp. TaxID=1871086 RepID=UPI0027366301|nr:type II toxin-antitoxin system VapC family toxin [Brevundimonas sp.]MDP3404399.1 type II toxin-antitoxin system VapC family toxin [Brevundimonas sp.]
MPFYLDSSVLVAVIEDEPTRPLFDDLLMPGHDVVLVSDFTVAETSGALVALWRGDRRTPDSAAAELSRFDQVTADIATRVYVDRTDMAAAIEFVRRSDIVLRGPDAIHVAAAHRLGATLLTLDRGMAHAAAALGVSCLNPVEGDAPGDPKD